MKYLKRLKDMREDRDLTQRDIAEVLKTSTQYYQKYEKGIIPVPADRLEALADFYETSVDYLLERTNEKTPYPKRKPQKR